MYLRIKYSGIVSSGYLDTGPCTCSIYINPVFENQIAEIVKHDCNARIDIRFNTILDIKQVKKVPKASIVYWGKITKWDNYFECFMSYYVHDCTPFFLNRTTTQHPEGGPYGIRTKCTWPTRMERMHRLGFGCWHLDIGCVVGGADCPVIM